MLYNTREDFIVLKNVKKYLFKLNNNQRANYQLKIFKIIFIRIIIDEIKKTFYYYDNTNYFNNRSDLCLSN